jgi:hypothetical protein
MEPPNPVAKELPIDMPKSGDVLNNPPELLGLFLLNNDDSEYDDWLNPLRLNNITTRINTLMIRITRAVFNLTLD